MSYKHSESSSYQFTKPKHKLTHWAQYNDALRQRGDVTIWFTEAVFTPWRPAKTGARGRPQHYSDHGLRAATKASALPKQKTETWFSALSRNVIPNLGMPVSVTI